MSDLKGTLVYSLDNRVIAQNLTSYKAIVVNGVDDETVIDDDIVASDVDAMNLVVYWIDSDVMYRAAIPQDASQMAYLQRIRNVTGGNGLAYDWITGCGVCFLFAICNFGTMK